MITINQEIEKGIKAAPLDADCDSFNEVISALTDYVDELAFSNQQYNTIFRY